MPSTTVNLVAAETQSETYRAASRPAFWRHASLSVKGRMIVGFGLLVVLLAGVTTGAAYQVRTHQADLQELEVHSTRASLLQKTEAQAGISGLLLQRYVDAGGESYVQEINDHAHAAQDALAAAVALGGPAGSDQLAATGSLLVQDAARAAALRHSGDVAGAAAVLEEIVPVFHDYRLQLESMAAQELDQVTELRARAYRAADIAFWLIVISGSLGTVLGLTASLYIARSIIKPLTSLEETTARAATGDLSVRASATGPRELAHFGSVLNHMMGTIEQRTVDLRRANSKLREQNRALVDARTQAATDPLTGLGNHRSFHRRLRDEFARAEVAATSLGLIMIDVDCFKAINDSLGHLAGDQLLRDLAGALTKTGRTENTYRYGGDELAVVLPGSDRAAASKFAESLRVAVCAMPQEVTISLGVAGFPETASSPEELIYRADMAMYWAKSTGKNRVGDWDGLLDSRVDVAQPRYLTGLNGRALDPVATLCGALAAKDPSTRDHAERCSWYTQELASELGLSEPEISALTLASLLHDVGKLVVPDAILRKPGPLDDEETLRMQRHPVDGTNMLTQVDAAADAIPAVLHHHEHFDGSGYPDGLSGEAIPLGARILLVTDAFDAMTTDRPYRPAMPVEAAIEELRRHSGDQFDPDVVEAFLRVISRTGSHVHATRTAGAAGTTTPASPASPDIEAMLTSPQRAPGDGASSRSRLVAPRRTMVPSRNYRIIPPMFWTD